MERLSEMTSKVTTLVRAAGMEDPGRVADAGMQYPDPEVPERARRRTFTAKYKLEVLAPMTRHPMVRRARCCAVRGCIPATSWSGGEPATPVRWRRWPPHVGASAATRKPSRSPACKQKSSNWSGSWPRPA